MAKAADLQRMTSSEFKAKCLGVLDEVNANNKEVIITKRGKAVAKLVPFADADRYKNSFGCMKGRIQILSDDIFSSGEVWNAERE